MHSFHGGHSALDVDDVLLSESSPVIRQYLRSLEPVHAGTSRRTLKRQRSGGSSMSDRAQDQHCDAYTKQGLDWWKKVICTEPNMQAWPGLRALTHRQAEVLEIKGFSVDHVSRRFATVDRTLPWCQITECKMPCLTASTKLYIEHRRRLAVGIELMRTQGVFLPSDIELTIHEQFDYHALVSIFGNSFDACCFVVSFLTLLSTLADIVAMPMCHANSTGPELPEARVEAGGTHRAVNAGFFQLWDDDGSSSSSSGR